MSTLTGVSFQYPSEGFSPPLIADSNLSLPAAKSTQVPQADSVVVGMKRGATGGTSLSITSQSSNTCSGLASIDLTQKTLDEESREKLKGKMKQLKNKLNKEKEFHSAMLVFYEDETV